jgi:anti-sigma B factor antagonist
MLQLATQHSDDVITIWCKGRVVLGGDLRRLKAATLSQNRPEVMLDLSSVNLIDAAGLGALVDLHKRFQCAGKKMELMDPTRFVSQVFRITRLDTVFHIVRAGQTAVARRNRRGPWSVFVQLFMTTLVAAGVVVPRLALACWAARKRVKSSYSLRIPASRSTNLSTKQSGKILARVTAVRLSPSLWPCSVPG